MIGFDQPVKNNLITYDNNRKIAAGQEMITPLAVYQTINTSTIIIK